MKSVILVGFMGTGKTTVGRALANALERPFVDLDMELEYEQGKAISEIFAQDGEARFRELEKELLQRYAIQPDLILSPGGGAVLHAENRAIMKRYGWVIGLTATPEVILHRVNQDSTVRPVLEQRAPGQSKLQRIEEVLQKRQPCYQEAALLLDTSKKSVDTLVTEIIRWLQAQEGEIIV